MFCVCWDGHKCLYVEHTEPPRNVWSQLQLCQWWTHREAMEQMATAASIMNIQSRHGTYSGHICLYDGHTEPSRDIFWPHLPLWWTYRAVTGHILATSASMMDIQSRHGTYSGHICLYDGQTEPPRNILWPQLPLYWCYNNSTFSVISFQLYDVWVNYPSLILTFLSIQFWKCKQEIVASELKDPIWHLLEWQIVFFSSEATKWWKQTIQQDMGENEMKGVIFYLCAQLG